MSSSFGNTTTNYSSTSPGDTTPGKLREKTLYFSPIQTSKSHKSSSIKDQLSSRRKEEFIANPDKYEKFTRKVLFKQYGVEMVDESKKIRNKGTKLEGNRVAGAYTLAKYEGTVPPEVRNDPFAKLPKIAEKDLEKGLLNLINRGLVPSYYNFTNVISKAPSPLVTETAKMHPNEEQYSLKKVDLLTEADFPFGAIATAKLDIMDSSPGSSIENFSSNISSEKNQKISVIPYGKQEKPILLYGESRPHTISYMIPSNRRAIPLNYDKKEEDVMGGEQNMLPSDQQDEIIHNIAKRMEKNSETTQTKEEKNRSYEELMDKYSSHNILIRKGNVVDSTPEFISYMRSYQAIWGPISQILKNLANLLQIFGISLAIVDGKKVAKLASNETHLQQISDEELLETLVNLDDVIARINDPANLAKFSSTFNKLAIRKNMKLFLGKNKYLGLLNQNTHAMTIQNFYKSKLRLRTTRNTISEKYNKLLMEWNKKMNSFKENWNSSYLGNGNAISKNSAFNYILEKNNERILRTIVHIPSLSYPEYQRKNFGPKFREYQNCQLPRILDLVEENVEVVYISPVPIDEECSNYYLNLLSARGIQNPEKRLKLLWPENFDTFPQHFCLAEVLLCSPRCLKNLQTFLAGRKNAFIVPGFASEIDKKLWLNLQLPVLGPDPSTSYVYGTKSGARRIFQSSDVNSPPGVYNLFNEQEIIENLAKKLIQLPEYEMWIIKIDEEREGRGLAVLIAGQIKALGDESRKLLMKKLDEEGKLDKDTYPEELRELLVSDLKENLSKYVVMCSPHVYPTWKQFLDAIKISGGCIEPLPGSGDVSGGSVTSVVGSPVANMLINPSGIVEIVSIQEQIFSPKFCCIGAGFPQFGTPHEAIKEAAISVGNTLFTKGVLGHVSVDFVVFTNLETNVLKIWGIDIKLGLCNNNVLMHKMFEIITDGSMNHKTGIFEPRSKLNADGESTDIDSDFGNYENSSQIDVGASTTLTISSFAPSSVLSDSSSIISGATGTTNGSKTKSEKIYEKNMKKSLQKHGKYLQKQNSKLKGNNAIIPNSPTFSNSNSVSRQKCYIYGGVLRHPMFSTWRHSSFFGLCKEHGFAYDVSLKKGVAFHLVHALVKGMFGFIVIEENPQDVIKKFVEMVDFVAGEANAGEDEPISTESNLQAICYAKDFLSQRTQQGT